MRLAGKHGGRPVLASRTAASIVAVASMATLGSGCAKPTGPWIHRIHIAGAKHVKERAIRGKLALQQASIIPFSAHHYLDHPYMVEIERERIETYYHARGFYSAHVVKAEIIKRNSKKPSVDIKYTVEEGEPTKIHTVTLKGLDEIGADGQQITKRINKISALKVGEIFQHPDYLIAKEDMQRLLQNRSYAFGKVHNEVDVNRDLLTADLHINAIPGKKVRIGKTLVVGTRTIDQGVVAKYAALDTGVWFKPELLEGAQGKLYNVGTFTSVLVEPVVDPNNPDVADVRIQLSEGKLRELGVGVGFGIEPLRTEIHTEVTFTKRSFLGGLRKMEVSFKPGYAALPSFWASDLYRQGPFFTLKTEFTQPDLIGYNSEFTGSIVYELGLDYAYQYHGPGTKIGLQKTVWRGQIKVAGSYNFQFLDFFNTDPAILGDAGMAGTRYGYTDPYRLGYLQEQVVLDLRNKPIDATRGFYAAILAEEGGVYTGSAFTYEKIVPEVRGYVPLGSHVVVAARLQYGQIFTHGDLGSPITQRLFLGGPNSHRGFTYNRLSYQVCSGRMGDVPVPTQVNCQIDQNSSGLIDFHRLPIGGDQMVLGQFEVRVNLFKLAGQWVSFASFVDAGDVTAPTSASSATPAAPAPALPCPGNTTCQQQLRQLSQLDLTKLHVAVGGGLRYRTVVGAIRLDLGVRVTRVDSSDGVETPDPGEHIAYHISIGEAF